MKHLAQALGQILGRGTIRAVNDASPYQRHQLEFADEEVIEDVPYVQTYGFASVPLTGAESVVIMNGGRREHAVVIASDDPRHRPSGMKPGEVFIYTDEGDAIRLKRGRRIEIETEVFSVKTKTLSVTAAAGELVALLLELIDELPKGKVGSASVTFATLPLVRAKFEQLKAATR